MAKSTNKSNGTSTKKTDDIEERTEEPKKLSEFVIKEIMIQKNCSREQAIQILQNPTKHPE